MSFFTKEKFKFKDKAEVYPFGYPYYRMFFIDWVKRIDGIDIKPVSERDEWEKIKSSDSIFTKSESGNFVLRVPIDLQIWEIGDLVESVDKNTFELKPEQKAIAKEKIQSLGKTFQNAGKYIAQRLDAITQGKEIAQALALEFYEYGHAFSTGKRIEEEVTIQKVAEGDLEGEELEAIDRFLAGDNLYRSLQNNQESGEGVSELKRRKKLAQFFRVSEAAFALHSSGNLKRPKNAKPCADNAPIHDKFLERVNNSLGEYLDKPKHELTDVVFRRMMQSLPDKMQFDKLPEEIKEKYLTLDDSIKTLREAMGVDQLKKELEDLKSTTKDKKLISKKEREIADKIQAVVFSFGGIDSSNNIVNMASNQEFNCVGASILGGSLMSEAGLNYLVADVPEHSLLFLVTSDGNVEWRDMRNIYPHPDNNLDLIDRVIDSKSEDGSKLTVSDIVKFSENPSHKGLMFYLKGDFYRQLLPHVGEGAVQSVTVFSPEFGQKIQLLNNIAIELSNDKDMTKKEDGLQAVKYALSLNPNSPYLYNLLGNLLTEVSPYERAQIEEAFNKSIAGEPGCIEPYLNLGRFYYKRLSYQPDLYDCTLDIYKRALVVAKSQKQHEDRISSIESIIADIEKSKK